MSLQNGAKVEAVSPPAYPTVVQTDKPLRPSKRKYLVAGVIAAVVVVAIVIGGALCGVYLQNQLTRDLVKEVSISVKSKDGKELKETVRVDPKKNEEEIADKDGSFRVIEDFNKGLSIMRTTMKKYACYVKPLNKTGIMDPKASSDYMESLDSYSNDNSSGTVDGDASRDIVYEAASEPIEDTSFLSASAIQLCKGLDVYWMLPSNKKNNPDRSKRYLCFSRFRRCCYWTTRRRCYIRLVCICDWFGCRWVTRYYCYYYRYYFCY